MLWRIALYRSYLSLSVPPVSHDIVVLMNARYIGTKQNFSQFCAEHTLALMFMTQNISDTAIFIAENIIKIDATTKQTRAINQPANQVILVILSPH